MAQSVERYGRGPAVRVLVAVMAALHAGVDKTVGFEGMDELTGSERVSNGNVQHFNIRGERGVTQPIESGPKSIPPSS